MNADTDKAWSSSLVRALALDLEDPLLGASPFGPHPTLSDYLMQLGVDPLSLNGNLLYEILAISPDGNLLFGSAGTNAGWGAHYQPETYFLVDLRASGNPAVPEPATWMTLAAAAAFVGFRRLGSGRRLMANGRKRPLSFLDNQG